MSSSCFVGKREGEKVAFVTFAGNYTRENPTKRRCLRDFVNFKVLSDEISVARARTSLLMEFLRVDVREGLNGGRI